MEFSSLFLRSNVAWHTRTIPRLAILRKPHKKILSISAKHPYPSTPLTRSPLRELPRAISPVGKASERAQRPRGTRESREMGVDACQVTIAIPAANFASQVHLPPCKKRIHRERTKPLSIHQSPDPHQRDRHHHRRFPKLLSKHLAYSKVYAVAPRSDLSMIPMHGNACRRECRRNSEAVANDFLLLLLTTENSSLILSIVLSHLTNFRPMSCDIQTFVRAGSEGVLQYP